MKLSSLELSNFRSYSSASIVFQEGITLFEGDIGCGKSSILYAIEFALFGLGDLRASFLLRNNAREGFVKLRLAASGREYEFYRSLERKAKSVQQSSAFIKENGEKTEYSPEEMKARVLKILGFNESPSPKATSWIYRYAVFTPQEEMKRVLELNDEERMHTLRKAFGIEEYKLARENSGVVRKVLREKQSFFEGAVQDLPVLKQELEELTAESVELSKKLLEKTVEATRVEETVSKERVALEDLRKESVSAEKIAAEIPLLTRALGEKKREVERGVEERKRLVEEASEFEKELLSSKQAFKETKSGEELRKELLAARKECDDVAREASFLQAKTVEEKKELERGIKEKKSLTEEENEFKKELIALQNAFKETKNEEDLKKELLAARKECEETAQEASFLQAKARDCDDLVKKKVCPTCGQSIPEKDFGEKLNALNKEFKEKQGKLTALKEKVTAIEKSLEEAREQKQLAQRMTELMVWITKNEEKNRALEQRATELREEIVLLDKQLEEKQGEATALKEKTAVIEKSLEEALEQKRRAQRIKELSNWLAKNEEKKVVLEQRLNDLRQEIVLLDKQLEEKKLVAEKTRELFQKIVLLERDFAGKEILLKKALQEKSWLEAERKGVEARISGNKEKIKEKEKQVEKLGDLQQKGEWLDKFFEPTVAVIEQQVLASINAEFDALLQKFFGLLMDYGDLSVRASETFAPLVTQEGFEQDYRALSGGEKSALALAYRLALNSVVKKVSASLKENLLILDEPTDGFSKEQLEKMRGVLEEVDCQQILLVSHERELEAFADNVKKIVKQGGESKIA